MKKKLSLDALQIKSFVTGANANAGTVKGGLDTYRWNCLLQPGQGLQVPTNDFQCDVETGDLFVCSVFLENMTLYGVNCLPTIP